MGPPPRGPPELMEDLVEEVLVRFPPEEPAHLVRAALVCKRWCRLISSLGFRRRFRQFHGRAPILGLFCIWLTPDFVPISSTCPPLIGDPHLSLSTTDARHGRVLLRSGLWKDALVVWDPITGERRGLPLPPLVRNLHNWRAAVLCAAAPTGACDHLDCHGGPFLVVLVDFNDEKIFAYVYSSEADAWSGPAYIQQPYGIVTLQPSALVGNAVYFAMVKNFKLYLCSTEAGPGEAARWTQNKVVELKTVLPIGAHSYSPRVVGFAEGIGVIFLRTSDGIFTIDPKSVQVAKICEEKHVTSVFPYTSFYIPAFEASSAADGPSSSSA